MPYAMQREVGSTNGNVVRFPARRPAPLANAVPREDITVSGLAALLTARRNAEGQQTANTGTRDRHAPDGASAQPGEVAVA